MPRFLCVRRFPAQRDDYEMWIFTVVTLNRQDLTRTGAMRICSKHFKVADFYVYNYHPRRLKKGSQPTIFPFFNFDEIERYNKKKKTKKYE